MLRQTLGWLGVVVPLELGIYKHWNHAPEEKIGKKEGQEKQELRKRVWMDKKWMALTQTHAPVQSIKLNVT